MTHFYEAIPLTDGGELPMQRVVLAKDHLAEVAALTEERDYQIKWRNHYKAAMENAPPEKSDELIKHMVNRFLGWRLPEHFRPDAGISFNPEYNVEYSAARGLTPPQHQPIGTNLFDATQVEAMVRYMLDGFPEGKQADA